MLSLSSADFVLKLSNTIFLLLSYKKVENGITNHAFNSSVKYDFIDVSIFRLEKGGHSTQQAPFSSGLRLPWSAKTISGKLVTRLLVGFNNPLAFSESYQRWKNV